MHFSERRLSSLRIGASCSSACDGGSPRWPRKSDQSGLSSMKTRADELELARSYTKDLEFEGLSEEQMSRIMERGRALHKWFKKHPNTHNLINVLVLLFLGITDFFTLVVLPQSLLHATQVNGIASILLSGIVVGSLHSWLMYSL